MASGVVTLGYSVSGGYTAGTRLIPNVGYGEAIASVGEMCVTGGQMNASKATGEMQSPRATGAMQVSKASGEMSC